MSDSQKERAARVAFIGLGRVGLHTLSSLLEAPDIEELTLADRRSVFAADLFDGAPLNTDDVGSPRADALVAALSSRDPAIRVVARSGPEGGGDWSYGWLEHCDLCVVASDLVVEDFLLTAHNAAFARGVTTIAGLCLGPSGWLGPRSSPGKGACLHCAILRIEAATGAAPFSEPLPPDPDLCARLGDELAREALRLLRGEEATTVGELHWFAGPDLDVVHPVLRTVACPTCGPGGPLMPYRSARPAPLQDDERSRSHILGIGARLVSPLTGPVLGIDAFAPTPGVPQLEHWWCEANDPAFGEGSASGVALDLGAANAAALGEVLERLASGRERKSDVFVASYEELGDDAVDPASWDLFHPRTRSVPNFPYAEYDARRPQCWLWGVVLPENRPIAIPVERVFVFTQPEIRHDVPVVSGFATGTSFCEALQHGLMEVLERDAFWIAWATRRPVCGLDPREAGSPFKALLAAFAEEEVKVSLVRVETDHGLPAVIGVSRSSRPGEPASAVSAAAGLDLSGAAFSALKELAASRRLTDSLLREAHGRLPRPRNDEVVRMGDHGLLYARPEMNDRLDGWFRPEETIVLDRPAEPPKARERLRRTLRALERVDLKAYAVDLTPPEITDLGLSIVKALVPGTYPMNFDSRFPHLGGKRLGGLDFDEFNTFPHPFP